MGRQNQEKTPRISVGGETKNEEKKKCLSGRMPKRRKRYQVGGSSENNCGRETRKKTVGRIPEIQKRTRPSGLALSGLGREKAHCSGKLHGGKSSRESCTWKGIGGTNNMVGSQWFLGDGDHNKRWGEAI